MKLHSQKCEDRGIRDIPDDLVGAILRLADLGHVYSFSLPFQDFSLWKGLVAAQVKRSLAIGRKPYQVMTLIATAGSIPGFDDGPCRADNVSDSGVFVSSDDSLHPGNVFAYEGGGGLDREHAQSADNLSHAVFASWYRERNNFCKYFLTRDKDCGAIEGATRQEIGDWVLYSAVDPYYADALKTSLPWNNGYIDPDSKEGIYGHV